MIFDPDSYLGGGIAPVVPRGTFDPDAFLGGSGGPTPAQPAAPNWQNLYAGLDGLDARVHSTQRAAFQQLDRVSEDPVEMRARAINQTYLKDYLRGLDPKMIENNWQATKESFVENTEGSPKPGISDTQLYQLISRRMKAQAEADDKALPTSGSWAGGIWQELNKPIRDLPSAPKDAPDVPAMGIANPALTAGVYNGIKPLLEGLESPFGITTIGVGSELKFAAESFPAAKAALVGMTGFFAGLMGYQTVKALPETQRVLADPNSSTQEKVAALAGPAATGAAAVLGALGAAFEAMPAKEVPKLVKAMEGKTPGQAAEILRGEAVTMDSGPHSDFLNHAANELDKIEDGRAELLTNEGRTGLVFPDKASAIANLHPGQEVRPSGKSSYEIYDVPSSAGPRNATISTGTGAPTPYEQKMIEAWKKQIAADKSMEQEFPKPVGTQDGVHEWLTPTEEGQRAVGINRASMDRELEEMGLPRTTESETKTFDEGLQAAAKRLRRDPDAGQKLIEKLEAKPRPMTDDEVALLSREVNRLRLERDAAEEAVQIAGEDGDEVALAEAKAKVATTRDDYMAATSAIAKAGTQNGRALAFFKIMLKEDYSRAAIERKWTVANNGAPLEEAALKQIGELHTLLEKTQKAFDDYRAQQLAASREPPRRAAPPDKVKAAREPSAVSAYLSEQAKAARERLTARAAGRVSSGIDPADLADHAIIGADLLARGVTKFSEWGAEMVKEIGEHIRPYLKEIFTKAEQVRGDASKLQALKTRTETSTKAMQEKIASGDFSKEAPRPVPLDAEALRLKAENARVKRLVDLGEQRLAQENRGMVDKVRDAFIKWVRAGALSTPTVIEHLTGAAIIRPLATMAEQGVGYGLSKLLPELAARAPREGVPSLGGAVRAEAKGITEGMTTGMRGAFDILRNRDTNETALLDKAHLPPEMIEYMGQIHKALHYPTQINEYARALELREQHAIRNGIDPRDPVQQIRLMHEAWMDGNRSVFLSDNGISNAYQAMIRSLEANQKATGKPSVALKLLSTGLQTELPIVKVPTNVISEVFEILSGSIQGPARAAFEYARGGIKDLAPGEADQIMRLMKKGTLGAALTAMGYYGYENIGGFHVAGEKRAQSDVESGNIRAGEVEIPHGLLHNPYAYAVDFGATMHRAGEAALKHQGIKTDTPEAHALLAASLGVITDVPFVRETSTIAKYTDSREAGNALAGKAASILVPGGVSWIAAQLDKEQAFNPSQNPTPRKAEGLGEAIKKRVPGMREELPRQRPH